MVWEDSTNTEQALKYFGYSADDVAADWCGF